jgi:hypothetical protein
MALPQVGAQGLDANMAWIMMSNRRIEPPRMLNRSPSGGHLIGARVLPDLSSR